MDVNVDIQAKAADTIGKVNHNEALSNAAKTVLEGSSSVVDMFSVPVLEQIQK